MKKKTARNLISRNKKVKKDNWKKENEIKTRDWWIQLVTKLSSIVQGSWESNGFLVRKWQPPTQSEK